MITIHTRVWPGEPTPIGPVVRGIEDYPGARHAIEQALQRSTSLDVYVQAPECDGWFWDLAVYCPGEVTLRDDSPAARLKHHLGVTTLPAGLEDNPTLIIKLGLLDQPAPSEPVTHVWEWITAQKLGVVWTEDLPSEDHLLRLIEWFAERPVDPALQSLADRLGQAWTNTAPTVKLKSAYKRFLQNPGTHSLPLLVARALWSYDAGARASWLEAQRWDIDALLDIVEMLPAPERLPKPARQKFNGLIKAYWKGRLKDLTVPAGMTGLFEGERDALVERINSALRDCSAALVEQVRAKFAGLPDTDAVTDELRLKLPPPRPLAPDPQWGSDAEKWLRWAANSYIPYRFWMIANGQEDATLEQISLIYEDWLYRVYPKLLEQPACLVYGVHREVEALLDRGETVLWTVIDNLPYFQVEMLAGQLSARHFAVEQAERRLSMLPSETGVSRRAALTGWLPDESLPGKTEAEAAQKAWSDRTHKPVAVLKALKDLSDPARPAAQLYIYVHGGLDQLAHMPDSKDLNRTLQVGAALGQLTADLAEAMARLSELGPASLVITSDHGSTSFGPGGQTLSVPQSAQADEDYQRHRRFIHVSAPQGLNPVEWFVLDREHYHVPATYAVARGWRYIGARPQGFTHGGLTPEETIVPLLICRLGESEFGRLEPLYHPVGEPLRPGRPGELVVQVTNPYHLPIERMEITLPDSGHVFPSLDVPAASTAQTASLPFEIQAKARIEGDTVPVKLLAIYYAGAQRRTQQVELRVKVRRLMQPATDEMGDLFS